MSFRFRWSKKISPGLQLNVGKRSTSVRIGPKGAGLTFGSAGTTASAGMPGTGISYSQKLNSAQPPRPSLIRRIIRGVIVFSVSLFLLHLVAIIVYMSVNWK